MSCTFSLMSIAFNQESYVIQHLESIKHIILKYGKNENIQIVFCDDASTDKTLELAKKWLTANNELFIKIDIVSHKKNIGTVRNILSGVEKCESNNIKYLACDDIYNDVDIFSLCKKYDFVITPVIEIDGKKVLKRNKLNDHFLRIVNTKDRNNYIKKALEYDNILSAPGVFIKKWFFNDTRLIENMKKYKYIEDYPMWSYIFKTYGKSLRIGIECEPCVLYNKTSGVSNNITNIFNNDFAILKKEINMKRFRTSYHPNVYETIYQIDNFVSSVMHKKNNKKYTKLFNDYSKKCEAYLDLINANAKEFMKIAERS